MILNLTEASHFVKQSSSQTFSDCTPNRLSTFEELSELVPDSISPMQSNEYSFFSDFESIPALQTSSTTTLDNLPEESPSKLQPQLAKPSKKISKCKTVSSSLSLSETDLESQATSPNKKQVKKWTREEDARIFQLISVYGYSWFEIAKHFPGRNGKQIRDHFMNLLCPGINKGVWTEEEDRIILELVGKVGNKWKIIAQNLPGRTENQVKNRYHGNLKKKLSSSSLSEESTPKEFSSSDSLEYNFEIPNFENVSDIDQFFSFSSGTNENDYF